MIKIQVLRIIKSFFIFLIIISTVTDAKDRKYDIKRIPLDLLKDAEAVVRKDSVRFEVKNDRRAIEKHTVAYTIFKKEKRDYGYIDLHYDTFRKIEEFEGTIYDADGNEIREFDDSEIKDYTNYAGYAFFSDSRVKVAELYYDKYPYTVEFVFEYEHNGYLNWPSWGAQNTLDAVERSTFEVIMQNGDSLRFWGNSDSLSPTITKDGKSLIYKWSASNLPKLSKDIVGEDPEDYTTIIRIAPSLFKYDKYSGDMRTWKDFGAWDYSLLKDRDALPESAKKDINSIILPKDDIYTKIKKLYCYMQDRTRYISVSLGIGGWQPFEASFVHEKGYGDCKALSNYMVALLKEVGIVGYSVSILSGKYRQPFIENFPSSRFNHVIVCVPLDKDTIWLECTDQTKPFNHLGEYTENRKALALTPEGGVIVQTPSSTSLQNSQNRIARVTLTQFGQADVRSTVTRRGNQQDPMRAALYDASPDKQVKWILNAIGVQNANLKSYSINGLKERQLELTLSTELTIERFSSFSGNRIFFTPNIMERQSYIPANIPKRLSPTRFNYPYLDIDTVTYYLPKGFIVESIPKEVTLNTDFGLYSCSYKTLGDTCLVYTRMKEIRSYEIPANQYSEYRNFCSEIVRFDKSQVVLTRKVN